MAVIWPPYSGGGGGGGAVDSVNGQTGTVMLDAADVGAPSTAQFSALATTVSGKASQSDLDTLTGRVTAAEGDIDALQTAVGSKASASDLATLAGRVTAIEGINPVGSSDKTVTDIRALTQAAYSALTPVATTHYDIKP